MPAMHTDRLPNLHELLAFYLEAGVDCALMDEPADRMVEETIAPRERPTSAVAPAPMSRPATYGDAAPAPEVAVQAAREAARTAPSLEALRGMLEQFEGCALKSTATRLVFADGNPQARVMFVGEAPGREEDIEGLPFVGRSGQLLNRMIAAIGLDRSS